MKRIANERGFTLLELMVVVAIIAIIAGILVPNVFHARAQAAVSACQANLRSIATAAELSYTDNNAYPPAGNVDQSFGVRSGGQPGRYLTQVPIDPAGPGAYTFANNGAGYTITCPGGHDPTAMLNLPNAGEGSRTIVYDSTQGFSAR